MCWKASGEATVCLTVATESEMLALESVAKQRGITRLLFLYDDLSYV
jgi:peptidyl-tRNA hydrolase